MRSLLWSSTQLMNSLARYLVFYLLPGNQDNGNYRDCYNTACKYTVCLLSFSAIQILYINVAGKLANAPGYASSIENILAASLSDSALIVGKTLARTIRMATCSHSSFGAGFEAKVRMN